MTGAELKEIRERLGLGPELFAEKVGIPVASLKAYEAGSTPVRRVVENAARWVEHSGGPDLAPYCPACRGVGTVRRGVGRHARRIRCEACNGSATLDQRDVLR